MKTQIEIRCPDCRSQSVKKNGRKIYGKQNYQCKACLRQFIGDHALDYKGCHSQIDQEILIMLVRGCGIRDVAEIASVSIGKVLSTLTNSHYEIKPCKSRYDHLEVDELWTYVGKKRNKKWLLYAYDTATGEIVAYVWGKRDIATVRKLRDRLEYLGIDYAVISMDYWHSFVSVFADRNKQVGKEYTVGIEGNNCRIRHRVRRAFRRTCCFSKKLANHIKAFDLAFFYINHGYV